MEKKSIFSKLGLSSAASKIYLSLVRNHRLTIAELSRDTGIFRPMIYKTLPELLEHNLISRVKVGKRTMYIAENPTSLEKLIDDIKSELDALLPDLSQIYEGSAKRPSVRYIEGKKGIQHIYEDLMRRSKKGDSFYRYESPRDYSQLSRYYPSLYWKRATGPHGELEKWVITNEATERKRHKRLWRHVRIIPESYDSFDYNITQLIYKDTAAFIDHDTDTATLIKNKRFVDFQLKIFKLLFGKL